MQQKIFNLILEQEDVTWKTIIYDLVNSEQMDPWDINITLLTQKYIQAIKQMQEHDLKISGKIILAAAVLLKIKSTHLVEHDLTNLDKLFNQAEDLSEEEFMEELANVVRDKQKYPLISKQPQPRSRKVSVHDLVNALQRAMESKRKIIAKQRPIHFEIPPRNMDIIEVIYDLYHKIVYYTNKNKQTQMTFSQLLPPHAGKVEKVYTFIPLLHLENQRKVETKQKKHFDEIYVKLLETKPNK